MSHAFQFCFSRPRVWLVLRYASLLALAVFMAHTTAAWGFEAHRNITRMAVLQLPPPLLPLYRTYVHELAEASLTPDRRRYVMPAEGPRHYLAIDLLKQAEQQHNKALMGMPQDSVLPLFGTAERRHLGTLPWHVVQLHHQLTQAMAEKKPELILKLSADLSHYLADAHVPLHAHSNFNGQQTNQRGIHGLWETTVPHHLTAFWHWNPTPIPHHRWQATVALAQGTTYWRPLIWQILEHSFQQADTVLRMEQEVRRALPPDQWYSVLPAAGIATYSTPFITAYGQRIGPMVRTNMQEAAHHIAEFWYSCWLSAGQPDLVPTRASALPPGYWQEQKNLREALLADTTALPKTTHTDHCGACCQF